MALCSGYCGIRIIITTRTSVFCRTGSGTSWLCSHRGGVRTVHRAVFHLCAVVNFTVGAAALCTSPVVRTVVQAVDRAGVAVAFRVTRCKSLRTVHAAAGAGFVINRSCFTGSRSF